MADKVPFVDIRANNEEVREAIETAIKDIVDRSSFIGGSYVLAFEQDFADYIGVKEAVAVANGTDALWLALMCAGVERGDSVITVPNTFIATVEAITRLGARPLFADIDLETSNIDLDILRGFLDKECRVEDNGSVIHIRSGCRVAAILPVHLYGLPVHMEQLIEVAEAYGLPVIEDACQAHGARAHFRGEWRRAGSIGVASGFSFYPAKNLGAMGDGGAVVTNDPEMAIKMRWLRDHGSTDKYIHISSNGWNTRLDAIQAAVLSIKLKKLAGWNANRRKAAAHYQEVLGGLPLELPVEPSHAKHVYHLYVVRTPNRDYLWSELVAKGIGVGMHYPIPLHLQEAYRNLGHRRGDFPNAERSAATLVSLPMHPALTQSQIEHVSDTCREILVGMPA